MTDTSSTTGIAITPWARTIKGRPAIGGFAERTRRTGMGDVAMFTEMTGDRNPLHYDAAARRRIALRRPDRAGWCHFGSAECGGRRGSPRPWHGFPWRGVAFPEGRARRRGNHRPRRGRHRSRRQADLHNGNLRSQRARRSLSLRQRRHLHRAAAGGKLRPWIWQRQSCQAIANLVLPTHSSRARRALHPIRTLLLPI